MSTVKPLVGWHLLTDKCGAVLQAVSRVGIGQCRCVAQGVMSADRRWTCFLAVLNERVLCIRRAPAAVSPRPQHSATV
jgi:hypothetical protein